MKIILWCSFNFILLKKGHHCLFKVLIIAIYHKFVCAERCDNQTGPILEWASCLYYCDIAKYEARTTYHCHNVEVAQFVAFKLVVQVFLILFCQSITIE